MPKAVKSDDSVKDGIGGSPPYRAPSLAQQIDESVWFHTIYGSLDGLNVSYSTLKFLCDISAKSQDTYQEHLNHLLTDPEGFLPLLLLETCLITTFSIIGNRASKIKNPKAFHKFCRDYWPYIRDVLRGTKNGYRGIKSLFGVGQHLNLFNAADVRMIAIPIGITFGMIGMINRLFNRYVSNQRKELEKRLKTLKKDIEEHEHLLITGELDRLQAQRDKYDQDSLDYLFYQKKMKAFSQKEITLKKEYTALSNETTHFENSFKYRFLTASSIIGAIADGPYLYAGVLLLGTLPTPLMIVTATILTFLFIALIFSRYNDCQEKKQEFKQKKLETTLAWQRQELQKAIALYQTFLFSHKNADNELIQQQIVSLHLRELYTDFLATDDELKKLIAPSYKQAVLGGVKDGLYFFGALSSIYFAVGLFLFLSATAFPPAMVVAAAFISVVAMTGFIIKRVHQTKKDKKNFRHYLIHEKQKHDQEREEQFLDYILDCNDDGLTKGQFYFQESFEVVRSIGSGPYKSNNLTDFMLSTLKEKEPDGNSKDSHFMLLFWGGVSILYGLCLAIRAYGQGFSKIVKADKAKLSHATDETALSSKKEDEIEEKDLPSPPKPQLHRSKSFSSHARFFKSEKSLGNTGPAPQSTDKDTTPSSPEFPLKRATSQASIFQKQSRFFKSDQSAAEPHHEFTEPLPKTTSLVA